MDVTYVCSSLLLVNVELKQRAAKLSWWRELQFSLSRTLNIFIIICIFLGRLSLGQEIIERLNIAKTNAYTSKRSKKIDSQSETQCLSNLAFGIHWCQYCCKKLAPLYSQSASKNSVVIFDMLSMKKRSTIFDTSN